MTAAGASRPAFPEQIAEQVGECPNILEPRRGTIARGVFAPCVFAVIALLRPLLAARVDLAEVVTPALVGVAENVVGGGNLLELVLGGLVARIEVRMQRLRELAVSLGNVLGACVPRYAEN